MGTLPVRVGSTLGIRRVHRLTRDGLGFVLHMRTGPAVGAIVAMLAASWLVGYLIGGANVAAPHWFYIPVFYAAARFGCRWTAVVAAAAGVVAGPLLPGDVGAHVAQRPADWGVRLAFLVIVGQAMALVITRTRDELRSELDRLRAERAIRVAYHRGEFEVRYQPIVALGTGEVVGAEALVRWNHPERGLLAPSEFVPVAEQSGLIVDIGADVLREACAAAIRLGDAIRPRPWFKLAVNVSARQLDEPDFPDLVAGVLADLGLPASWLHLELTETALSKDAHLSARHLDALRALGVRIALDDFGTGHSSLTRLRQLPVDVVKLDRSFVSGIDTDPHARTLAAGIVALAREFELVTVGEGVERLEEAECLQELGCALAQGYLFSAAVRECELLELLRLRAPFAAVLAPITRLRAVPRAVEA